MLRLYNTFTRKKEEFRPLHAGKASMYVCGPTVYDYAHLGNLKAYVNADTLRRYLEYLGCEVRMIKNITDVGHLTNDDTAQGDSGDDKILRKAAKERKTPEQIAHFYEDYFHDAEARLNILPAHFFPRATAHIPHMIRMIEKLLENGHAYESNGNVFFDVTSFGPYGTLSGNSLEQLKVGARLDESHPDKRNQWDFALWLKAPENHIMKWQSPWGTGYPGWHIECSAMSTEYLGDTFDIHTGGEDHIFPHHEAEIAQAEGSTGKRFARWWMHERHMLIDGVKMSKSKGNFYVLEDIERKGFDPMDLRMLILSSHYRSQMNFTWEALEQARKNLRRIREFMNRMKDIAASDTASEDEPSNDVRQAIAAFETAFVAAMDDDLNTPLALSEWYAFITAINTLLSSSKLTRSEASALLGACSKTNIVFGFSFDAEDGDASQQVHDMLTLRKNAREKGNFALSDKLRDDIRALGFLVEDSADGQRLKKL